MLRVDLVAQTPIGDPEDPEWDDDDTDEEDDDEDDEEEPLQSQLNSGVRRIRNPDSGSIKVDGRDIARLPPEKRGTAMMFQSYRCGRT
jgi:hypothetical protein